MIAFILRGPLRYRGESILETCMSEAGLRRGDVEILALESRADWQGLNASLEALAPSLIVALGNEAASAVLPAWDGGIEMKRGFVWDGTLAPTLVTIHPGYPRKGMGTDALNSYKPFKTLLSFDLQRAKEIHEEIIAHGDLLRPHREVEIITSSRSARSALDELRDHAHLAADIETYGNGELACIGFAGQSGKAFVFPAVRASDARELLEDPELSVIWANGIYDLFVLKHREGWEVGCDLHDVQLLWHSMYPELAGKAEGSRRNKVTRKSLAFLASLCTLDPWWKGDYETEEEFFVYNGKDCCITLDVFEHFLPRAERAGALPVYDHERALMMPCVDMLARGLRVDERLRRERLTLLDARYAELDERLNALALPLIERERERIEDIHLFEQIERTCECCGHGSKKQSACWECAGLEAGYLKRDLQRLAIRAGMSPNGHTKAELEEALLETCAVCGGEPRREYLEFNGRSPDQAKVLLYDVLRLPKRTEGGKLTTNERALKDLVGVVS